MCGKKTRGPWWEEPVWERATSPQLVCGLPEGRVQSSPPLSQHRIRPGTWQGLGEGAGGLAL